MTMMPDYHDQKGSLTLRSDHMNYSRAIKNSNWHQARQQEPKDYDISKGDVRDLCKPTYHRIGNVTDGSLPQSTYQDTCEQLQKDIESGKEHPKQAHIVIDIPEIKKLQRGGHNAIQPEENTEREFDTTHLTDYRPPYPYVFNDDSKAFDDVGGGSSADVPDYGPAYKRCLSQFTDTMNHRRSGWNTWQDESGVYANSHFKAQAPVYQKTKPIATRLK